MLHEMRDFLSEQLKSTYQRVRTLLDVHAEPHIKLLLIDGINYFLGLLQDNDRRQLLLELNEQQRVLDETDPNSMTIRKYMQKESDLEFSTLLQINEQMAMIGRGQNLQRPDSDMMIDDLMGTCIKCQMKLKPSRPPT